MADCSPHGLPRPHSSTHKIHNQLSTPTETTNQPRHPHITHAHNQTNRFGAQKRSPTSSLPSHAHSLPPSLTDLTLLRRQIQQLPHPHPASSHLAAHSQAHVLHKRRNILFRAVDKPAVEQRQEEDRSVAIDHFLNRKKQHSKNSLKIQKFLQAFLSKGVDQIKSHAFLDFISIKHKIPVQAITKPPKPQIGYREADLRKIKKYQLNPNNVPQMGSSYDHDNHRPQQELQDQTDIKSRNLQHELYLQEEDCFELRPTLEGYRLPQHSLQAGFCENKRQVFKLSRNMLRNKLEKQATLKRLAYHCVREVQKRYMRCIRNQNQFTNRAKKLHRECLVYWRKREKQLVQTKKRKDRLQTELKRRDEEQQQAKKMEKRLKFIMEQAGIYSHFMATKLGVEAQPGKQPEGMMGNQNGNKKEIQIDRQAAMLNVNQMINNKMDNLEKFDKKKEGKLDLSSVDQGKLELVDTPSSFHGTLKEYQIKGLRWLHNLFEQGINGILADQMGLGKTIQAISLLAQISQKKGIWGPFLIVAPNSTLFNWQQQFKKFCPSLRVLPYWGNIKQRKTIRKFFSPKKFTQRPDSPYHVVITSYQLTVTDDKTFKRMKWQFMILDQAQAIKNILSQRWNTLKEFQSRNRLLLTGTPIQNNMAELWALLNFVMPDLFDSHQLFNEWFSKDIEAHSQDQKQLDQIKIQRLHAILKPFMLRRIKKDVQHQIGKKYEHQILCEMTKRQKLLYESIKDRLNLKELFKMFESKLKVQNLMNLVMQLRKVCNHPELFERRPAQSPFCFQEIYYYTGHIPMRTGQIKYLSNSSRNPIQFDIPKVLYDQLMRFSQRRQETSKRLVNIYTVDNQQNNPGFSCMALTHLSLSEVRMCFEEDPLFTGILLAHWMKRSNYAASLSTKERIQLSDRNDKVDYRFKMQFKNQVKSLQRAYIPNATAPLIQPTVMSSSFYEHNQLLNNNKLQKYYLQGRYPQRFQQHFGTTPTQFQGLLNKVPTLSHIKVIQFGNLIADSSKLRKLDQILKEKKKNGDKVLIFCQMTKMIDILEDFMNLRRYTFFRLDGACNIADRRDMVNDFQKPQSKVFVFLLSTRAGGLGVTLTAANTVIFYDNDWNPTMDAQATDRAHRIGQSRDVNVYQLVTKATIEQRIVKRAQQKKTVQSTVYEGASFNFFKKDMIFQLVADQFEAEGVMGQERTQRKKDGQVAKKKGGKGRPKEEKGEAARQENGTRWEGGLQPLLQRDINEQRMLQEKESQSKKDEGDNSNDKIACN